MTKIHFRSLELGDLQGDVADALSYWKSLTGPREMPSWADFDLMKIPTRVVKTTHVLDIEKDAEDYTFRFWGTGVTEIHNQELTGKYLSELRPSKLAELAKENIKLMIELRKPVAVTTALMSRESPERFQVVLRLPLSSDGNVVTQVVTLIEYPQGRYHSRDALESVPD